MDRNTAEIHVGRLLEIRLDAGYRTLEDVDALCDQLSEAVRALQSKHVTVIDWRRCPFMSDECAKYVGTKMAWVNARTERTATIVTADLPANVIQLFRLIKEAKNPMRQLFDDEADAIRWLSEVLTAEELVRAREFLSRSATSP
jgi:hypothetical protein